MRDQQIDRRGFLKCMAWAGTGMVWTLSGGALTACEVGAASVRPKTQDILFVQISDSHIGFKGKANADVTATFGHAIDLVNALPKRPEFVLHTGDLTHLAAADEFDTVHQMMKTLKTGQVFPVPGEHDALQGSNKLYLQMFGQGTKGTGWYSFDHHGVHFVGLVNALAAVDSGMGHLGPEQLDWLKKDLAGLSADTPLVVFAHVPLFAVYPPWGWSTDDSQQALSYMRRFGSVNVLNGHIHQVLSKVEGKISFTTARATGFLLPKPGQGPGPLPVDVPPGKLRSVLGVREVRWTAVDSHLAIKDSTLDH
jgi:3',5'-cyclic AMP phosphodiesterase CpdA